LSLRVDSGLGGPEVVGDTSGEPVVRIDVILPNRMIRQLPPPLLLPKVFVRTPFPRLLMRLLLTFLLGEGCGGRVMGVGSTVKGSNVERLKTSINSVVGDNFKGVLRSQVPGTARKTVMVERRCRYYTVL
jgi:hypothetical protein